MATESTRQFNKVCYQNGTLTKLRDELIVEQPIALFINVYASTGESLFGQVYWITLRTPGEDKYLFIGYLLSQGIIRSEDDIKAISSETNDQGNTNTWEVTLKHECLARLVADNKAHSASASCGLCGSTSIKALELNNPPAMAINLHWLKPEKVFALARQLTEHQNLFKLTGGVHGAALCDRNGTVLKVFEDIGRHNALDKLLGFRFLRKEMQSVQQIVVMSSRASFDILQKIVMSGIEVLITIGAPSDLAVKTAQRFDVTLIGFVKKSSFNIYHDPARLTDN